MELIVQYMGKLLLRNKWNKADVHRRLCTVDKLTKIRAGHLHQCSHQGVNDVEAINWTLTQWREFWNIGGLMVDATKIWGEFASKIENEKFATILSVFLQKHVDLLLLTRNVNNGPNKHWKSRLVKKWKICRKYIYTSPLPRSGNNSKMVIIFSQLWTLTNHLI